MNQGEHAARGRSGLISPSGKGETPRARASSRDAPRRRNPPPPSRSIIPLLADNDLTAVDANGVTPLHRAAEKGSLLDVYQSLHAGADPNVRDLDGV